MAKSSPLPYLDFLDSETIALQAGESGRPFHIHRKLLGSKSKTLLSAFERGFQEGQRGTYTFQDTTEGTLARFVEWAYTGDYPASIKRNEPKIKKTTKTGKPEAHDGKKDTLSTEETDFTCDDHPLLTHIRLYVFCGTYLIPNLQKLAFEKTTTCFTDLDKSAGLNIQLAVIAALRMSFQKLPTNGPLLDWLAQYAAYSVEQLRLHKEFHDLLQESPALASRMVLYLNPASSPPWKTQPPKHRFKHYSPDNSYNDGYD